MSVSKMIMGQAANQYVAPTYVENVFSTYLYEGTSSAKTITNGIDLDGEGGLVWIKRRDGNDHALQDTERGATKFVRSNTTAAEATDTTGLTSFNSNGFTLGISSGDLHNKNNVDHVSWTFRKQPKFFDVVTYTGNGSNRTIAHNLGCEVGMMLVKLTSGSDGWAVYHRGVDSSAPEDYRLRLDGTNARIDNTDGSRWNRTAPTSSVFSLGTDGSVNANGSTYVAYLFAHNDGDGDFGVTNDQDIIKCGSYTGNAGTQSIDVGFEPQWIIIKNTNGATDWSIVDVMRGMPVGENAKRLMANNSNAEQEAHKIDITPTGFHFPNEGSDQVNANGNTYIYMAIRRGPMATPTSTTDVFAIDNPQSQQIDPGFISGFPVDFALAKIKNSTTNWYAASRLTGNKYLETNNTTAEQTTSSITFDYNNGWWDNVNNTNFVGWMWKRAPSFFDVVAYSGTDSARTQSHNLGVVPEMIWIKRRDGARNWYVWSSAMSNASRSYMHLNTTAAEVTSSTIWNDTAPTSSVFSLGGNLNQVNESGENYIAYLFATVAGISKVGSYTGTGNNIDIDCGFSSGARFVLIKRTDTSVGGSWWVIDTVRGLTSGNDPIIRLDTNDAEYTSFNPLTPLSSGFTVASTATADFNASGGSYIFYAIS